MNIDAFVRGVNSLLIPRGESRIQHKDDNLGIIAGKERSGTILTDIDAADFGRAVTSSDSSAQQNSVSESHANGLPNGSRLSCGALKKDSFHNLRAPPASSAC